MGSTHHFVYLSSNSLDNIKQNSFYFLAFCSEHRFRNTFLSYCILLVHGCWRKFYDRLAVESSLLQLQTSTQLVVWAAMFSRILYFSRPEDWELRGHLVTAFFSRRAAAVSEILLIQCRGDSIKEFWWYKWHSVAFFQYPHKKWTCVRPHMRRVLQSHSSCWAVTGNCFSMSLIIG